MKNSQQNTSSYKNITNAEKLVLVRTNIIYGIKFERIKQESSSYNSGITSIPTFIFFDNNTKCFLDFTNQTNKALDKKVDEFFLKIPINTTFFITNALYENSDKVESANLSGEFVITDYFNGIVTANVTSVTSLESGVTRYDKKYFQEIPILVSNTIQSSVYENITIIKNVFGSNTKNSFNYMGAKVGDFLSFSGVSSKYEIIELTTDPNGIEVVKVRGFIEESSLVTTKVLVSLHVKVKQSYTLEVDIYETDLGACTESINGVIVSCTNNNTLSQCRVRSNLLDNITTSITFNSFCATPETDTAVELSTTDQLVQITNLLASNIAIANSTISNIAGPVNKNGNSKNSFYGR